MNRQDELEWIDMSLNSIQIIAVWILPLLFAITLHEAAHAFVANHYGDPTAKSLGRLSLNPIKHIDLFGTIIVPIVLLVLSGFSFTLGWAKPVPIDHRNFKNPKHDLAIASVAGPAANIIMALFWLILLKALLLSHVSISNLTVFIALMCKVGIVINLILAILNMIPIPPLDGSRVVSSLLSTKAAILYNQIEPYGIIILIILMATGLLGGMLTPMLQFMLSILSNLFNLPSVAS